MLNVIGLVRGALAAFFGWWWGELAGLVPRRFRQATRRERRGLVLVLGSSASGVLERTPEGERALGSVPVDAADHDQRLGALLRQAKRHRRPVTVRLSGELGLRKIIDLPLATKDDLAQLLRFEMDRLTPFRAEEVYFAQRVVGSDAQNRRITVNLQVAPKRVVEQALETARGFGVIPARIELDRAEANGTEPLNLLPDERGQGARQNRLNRALALLALVLAVIAVIIPLRRHQATVAELEAQVAAAQAEAEESLTLRERLDQLSESARFLLTEKTRRPMVTEVLAELTRLVPDQAHIIQLQLRDDTVQLHGFAATASDLIGLLEQSPLFRAPQFRSPVTQDPNSGSERFHVSVELIVGEDG